MKLRAINLFKIATPAGRLVFLTALLLGIAPMVASAQMPPRMGMPPGFPMGMPSSPPNAPAKPDSGGATPGGPWVPSEPLNSSLGSTNQSGGKTNGSDGIQLSFQGANIDMIVQWLAQTTGKTVLKHPQVQCQLTITSSKKVTPREAINLVYRALSLEGYTAIELTSSIIIVPEGKEPLMSPELVDASQTNVPEGRQRLVKVFSLKHVQAADLKDRIHTALTDKATIEIDEVANQIIITDYNDNIRAVGILISALDTAKPEDVTVRVIALKNVAAADLMKEIEPLYQKKNSKSLKDTVEVTADAQANSLLILSSEVNFEAISEFVAQLDTKDAQDKVMKTFTLKNADAQDVAKQLQDLNQDQASSTPRYFYSFSSQPDKSAKKMTVVADRRRNAIIVQAPPAQMDGIAKMVGELDEALNDDSLAPKIYPLKYVSASDLEDVLNELFLKKTQQRSYWDFFDSDSDSSSTPDRDVGRLYGKVRITSEPYSNALIVTSNSKENLAAVETIIKQLDQPSEAGESTLHCGLKFAKAATVANDINILFAKNGSPPMRGATQPTQPNNSNGGENQQGSASDNSTTTQAGFDLPQATKEDGYFPWLGGRPDDTRSSDGRNTVRTVSDLVGRVRAVADERSNAVLISANVHFFPQILKLIEDLDAPTDQVLIEARLVEVSSDFLDKMGVRWGPSGGQLFTADDNDNALLAHTTVSHQQGFGGNTTVNYAPSAASELLSPASLLTAMRSGVVDSTISLDYLVQFLRKTTEATVLAEPQINIRDNETGRLFVGQEVPIPDNSLNSSVGTTTSTFKYKDVGIVLEVTPHINTAGDVELKVHAESSSVVAGDTINGGSVFDTRNFRTDLTAKNGQTLVLGGIIQKQLSDTLRKTPLLGDIPGLKWLFNKKDKSSQDVELMVFLRPHVVKTPEDAQKVLRDVEVRAPLVKQWSDDTNKKKN
jgi:type II secretion system protein D